VDDVKDCIRAVRSERPDAGGVHGYGMRRSVGYVVDGPEAWAKAMDDIVIAIMIEKTGAMDNLEKILSVPGVDMVQFGPSDLLHQLRQTRPEQIAGDTGYPEKNGRNGAEKGRCPPG